MFVHLRTRKGKQQLLTSLSPLAFCRFDDKSSEEADTASAQAAGDSDQGKVVLGPLLL